MEPMYENGINARKTDNLIRKAGILFAFTLAAETVCGCGSSKNPVQIATVSETSETECVVPKTEFIPEEITENATETVLEETYPSQEQMTEDESFLAEWIASLKSDDCNFCIWNKIEKQGELLENGGTYKFGEGDELVLYRPVEISAYSTPGNATFIGSYVYDSYDVILMKFDKPGEYEFGIASLSGERTYFDYTIIPPLTEDLLANMTGEEWAKYLMKDTPTFIVWNDVTGLKKELSEGEEYQLQAEDVLAVYHGTNYKLIEVLPEGKAISSYKYYDIIRYAREDSFDVTASLSNVNDTTDVVELSFTLLQDKS